MKKLFLFLLILSSLTCSNVLPSITAEGFERFINDCFVETGTYKGDGTMLALRAGFKEIYTIEIGHDLAIRAKNLFSSNPNVNIVEGDSGKILFDVIKDINKQITFWLDGHNSGADTSKGEKMTALLEELEQIKKHPIKNHTILIDDIRDAGTIWFDYITKEQIINKILEINPNYKITYINGCNGITTTFYNDIMVAIVPENSNK